jgi:tetratricopeptide (TPR) repeat protein
MKIQSHAFFAFSLVVLFCFNAFAQQTADAFYKQGVEQIKTHKYDAAIVSFTEAIKLNPTLLEAYLERSKARENNQRDLEGAFADVEKVIELNPSHGEAYFLRAGIRNAQIVKRKEPSNEIVMATFRKMLADFDLAINYGYKTKDAYKQRAGLKCSFLDDCKTAIADYDAAIALAPNDFYLYINRSNAKRSTKDFVGAVTDLREIVSRYYGNQSANTDEKQKKMLDEQRGAVSMALLNLTWDLMMEGSHEQALGAMNQAIELNPENASAYDARGRHKTIFGDLDEAIADFDKAIEFRQNNGMAYLGRAIALALQGKTEEAQKSFDKGFEILPHLKNQYSRRVELVRRQREQKKIKVELPE